jgi:hypothetical protein
MSKKNHNNGKVAVMIEQMASFKGAEGYYSTEYSSSYNNPKIWWQMIEDPNNYLKNLAIKLFSITPHNAACERAFSTLGFLYGKRRQCLNISTVEMMARIRYYFLSNAKIELNHFKSEETEAELKNLIQQSGFFYDDEEDDESNEEGDDLFNINEDDSLETQTSSHVFIINDMVDMNNPVFTGELVEKINNDNSDDESDENLEEEELDFEIISRISAPSNM